MSHLFHRTHEQHYVAHAIAYSACMGPSAGRCERPAHATFTRSPGPPPGRPAQPSGLGTNGGAAPLAALPADSARSPKKITLEEPKFPTLSPVLQQLLDDNEQKVGFFTFMGVGSGVATSLLLKISNVPVYNSIFSKPKLFRKLR